MMKGKLTGFIKIRITPIVNGSEYYGPLLIAIHNFTGERKSGLSERLILDKSAIFPRQFIFKVNRIPISVIKGKIIYKPHEFFIQKPTVDGMKLALHQPILLVMTMWKFLMVMQDALKVGYALSVRDGIYLIFKELTESIMIMNIIS